MNTRPGNAAVNIWKRIKLQHIAFVGGLAISASAAIAVGTWEADSAPAAVQSRVDTVVAPLRPQSPFVYYLVGSEEDAIAIQSAIDSTVFGDLPGRFPFATLVVDTPELEALVSFMAQELLAYAPDARINARIEDMRGRVSALAVARPVPLPKAVYYLVDSQAQADYATYAEKITTEERALSGSGRTPPYSILNSSVAEEQRVIDSLLEASSPVVAEHIRVIDLRSRVIK